jgi:AraC-like DNA-binding protein
VLLERLLSNLGVGVEPFAQFEVPPGGRTALEAQPSTTLHFALSGEGAIRTAAGSQEFRGGRLAIVPSGMTHSLTGGAADLVVACGRVVVTYGSGSDVFGTLADALVVDLHDSDEVQASIAGLLAEHRTPRPGSALMQQALMDQCLVAVFRAVCDDPSCDVPWLEALDDPELSPALLAMINDPGRAHTVESLAATTHLSRAAFARRFRDVFGVAPMQYVRELRLREAARRLSGRQHVAAVARDVGYSSRSQFTRAFKHRFGVTPSEYREQGAPRRT